MQQQGQGGVMGLLFPIALFVLIFYFLIFRPQKKKQQQHEQMVASIGRGDTVITAGGFFGKVSDVLDDSYIIELAEGMKVRILKSSISVRKDGGDGAPRPDRPRRKKKRRDGAPKELADGAENSASDDMGVTAEENEALKLDAPAAEDAPVSEGDEATPEQKNPGGV